MIEKLRHARELLQHVDVALDERRLGDDAGRVPVLGAHLEAAAREPVARLERLVAVGHAAEDDELALPRRRVERLAQRARARRGLTTILRSKSVPAPKLRYSCDGPRVAVGAARGSSRGTGSTLQAKPTSGLSLCDEDRRGVVLVDLEPARSAPRRRGTRRRSSPTGSAGWPAGWSGLSTACLNEAYLNGLSRQEAPGGSSRRPAQTRSGDDRLLQQLLGLGLAPGDELRGQLRPLARQDGDGEERRRCPPRALPTAKVATGMPLGIWTMARSASRPSRCPDGMGTPSTGRVVLAATTPGRCAAPPAPAMNTSTPRASASARYAKSASGVRCALRTRTSWRRRARPGRRAPAASRRGRSCCP